MTRRPRKTSGGWRTAAGLGAGLGVDYAAFKAGEPIARRIFKNPAIAEGVNFVGTGIASGYAGQKVTNWLNRGRKAARR